MKFLSISPVGPYDNIGHAGGKTYNYYLKQLSAIFEVRTLFFCPLNEKRKIDLGKYGIKFDYVLTSGKPLINIEHMFLDCFGYLIYKNKMFSLYKFFKIVKYLDKLRNTNDLPDIIELEWTNFVFYADKIHKRYPSIKIIASEHDVNFQSLERKKISKSIFRRIKKQELEALNCCNSILVQSEKDKKLLVKEGIDSSKIQVIVPFYHDMTYINRSPNKKDILFWGAMYRPENYEAARWFVKNVMPLLEDEDIRFIIAGNKPPEELKKMESERIIVTGFIDDEIPLFEKSMCFVSPLLTGAGIKVKVIEALSSGIPVLTNSIGIEGISAANNKEYIHCETPEQYADAIKKILDGKIDERSLMHKQKEFIKTNYNLLSSLNCYVSMIDSL